MTESENQPTEGAAGAEAGPAGARTDAKEEPKDVSADDEKDEAPATPEPQPASRDDSADDEKDEAPATPETDDETAEEPTPDERLEALGAEIDQVRQQVRDPLNDGDEQFIQSGEADEDQPVDDTIAPPG